MTDSDSGYGQQTPNDSSNQFNAVSFLVRQMMLRMSTMKLVKVQAVHSNGEVAEPGTVDVLPLVNQIDGNNNSVKHGTVYGIPWTRVQSGEWAIIADPKVGDVGYVVVSDRDISNVKETKDQANPGSHRVFDLADGVYVGGCLNAAPTSYIFLKEDGHLKIVVGDGLVLETSSSGWALTGDLNVTGAINSTGEITKGSGGTKVTLSQHIHSANNTPPTPGH